MKVSIQTNDMESAGFEQSRTLGISESNAAKIFKVLTESLYSAGASAMARELISNALDEAPHASGPMVITTPTRLNPVFTIRDHGRGMSHDFVMNRAFSLGDSTKDGRGLADQGRADNADETIGGFGLGLKTPFILADQFTITVYRGTYAQTYVIDKPDGLPRVQTSDAMRRDLETPETGTEITVSLPTSRADELTQGIVRVLTYVSPDRYRINGSVQIRAKSWTHESPAYNVSGDSENTFILLGPIAYPMNWQALGLANGVDQVPRIALKFPAGAIEVTGSREAIKWTPRSVAVVKDAYLNALADMRARLDAHFASVTTLYGAWCVAKSIKGHAELINYTLTWRGMDLERRKAFPCIMVWDCAQIWQDKRPKIRTYFELGAGRYEHPSNMLFLLDDPACPARERVRRMRTAMTQNAKMSECVLVPRGSWEFALTGAPVQSIMDYEPEPLANGPRVTYSRTGKAYKYERGNQFLKECDFAKGGLYIPFKAASPDIQYTDKRLIDSRYASMKYGAFWGLNESVRKQIDMSVWRPAIDAINADLISDQARLKPWLETADMRASDLWPLAQAKAFKSGNAELDAMLALMRKAAPVTPFERDAYDNVREIENCTWIAATPQVMPECHALEESLRVQFPAFAFILDNARGSELLDLIPRSFG